MNNVVTKTETITTSSINASVPGAFNKLKAYCEQMDTQSAIDEAERQHMRKKHPECDVFPPPSRYSFVVESNRSVPAAAGAAGAVGDHNIEQKKARDEFEVIVARLRESLLDEEVAKVYNDLIPHIDQLRLFLR